MPRPPAGLTRSKIRGDAAKLPNTLRAAAPTTNRPAGTTTSTVVEGTTGAPAPIGTGSPDATGVAAGTVIYRVYLPKAANDPTGGSGLPTVFDILPDGTRRAVPTCAHAGANPAAEAIVNANGPATNTPAPAQPDFIRPQRSATNLYPDPDNIYLATIAHYAPGRIVVVRGKAPTFPDTSHGARVTGREQVRYWSLCTNEYRKPYPVSYCVADQDVTLDSSGNYTIVIATPADRPRTTPADGITWLDWGTTSVDNLLLMRQMLPNPHDPAAASSVAPGALASSAMGPYARREPRTAQPPCSRSPGRLPARPPDLRPIGPTTDRLRPRQNEQELH